MPVLLPFALVLGACEPAPSNPGLSLAPLLPQFDAEIDAILLEEWAQQNLPGLSVAVLVGEDLIHVGTYGYSDLDAGQPVEDDDLFAMNSMSKMLTAVVAKKLALQAPNDFSLNDEVRLHVPSFAESGPNDPNYAWREQMTVAQLLSNTGGLVHYSKLGDKSAQDTFNDPDADWFDGVASMAVYAPLDMVHEPGDIYHYSSYGFNLVGTVVDAAGQAIDGRGYQARVLEDIADAYGMEHLQPDTGDTPGKARRHNLDTCTGRFNPQGWTHSRVYMLPGSGWLSTPSSLAAFARGLLAEPASVTGDLWAAQNSLDRFRSSVEDGECVLDPVLNNGNPVVTDYGYGFSRGGFASNNAPNTVGHGGSHPRGGGAKSLTTIAVDHDYAIVLMTNGSAWSSGRIRNRIQRVLETRRMDQGLSNQIVNPPAKVYNLSGQACPASNCPRTQFAGTWRPDRPLTVARYSQSTIELINQLNELLRAGFVVEDLDVRPPDATPTPTSRAGVDLLPTFNALFVQVEGSPIGRRRYAVNQPLSTFDSTTSDHETDGYELLDLEIYDVGGGDLRWAAVYADDLPARRGGLDLSDRELLAEASDQARDGYYPVDLSSTGEIDGSARYAVVFEEREDRTVIDLRYTMPSFPTNPATQFGTLVPNILDVDFRDNGRIIEAVVAQAPTVNRPPVVNGMDWCGLVTEIQDRWPLANETTFLVDLDEY
ncbi:MAG: serine hydrolase domain-containing protein [Myxococcota bacterium]